MTKSFQERPAVAISACLAGVPCSYKCGHHLIPEFDRLREACELVYVCPETQGGLKAPREPAEIVGEKVLARDGADVTREFEEGARAAWRKAREEGCRYALLKEKSPSCGYGRVYDGTFTGTLAEGNGIAARLFAETGIEIFGESHASELLDRLLSEK